MPKHEDLFYKMLDPNDIFTLISDPNGIFVLMLDPKSAYTFWDSGTYSIDSP